MTKNTDTYHIYKDIQSRTKGEIYLGVVGPVRTGKSTFIKRFMDTMVLPNMEDEHSRQRARDELPLSAAGTMVTTTEPKFIPKDAAVLKLNNDIQAKVRLIDCVGFMVDGASAGSDEKERMVKTPWFEQEIPFSKAAEIGTEKVIKDHSTIGIVMTADGSFGDIPRENYIPAEEKTVIQLKKMNKPFVILLNSQKPYSEETNALKKSLEEKYHVSVIPVNCEQLREEDIHKIMEQVLYEFPITRVEYFMPKWAEMLGKDHKVKAEIIRIVKEMLQSISKVRDVLTPPAFDDLNFVKKIKMDEVNMANGCVRIMLDMDESIYYEILSELSGVEMKGEYELIRTIKELSDMRKEYVKVLDALDSVRHRGYGVVMPNQDEIRLEEPAVIKHGNKYGVKIKAESPSIHMIRANIETEIAPIVGSEQQAQDLISYIKETSNSEEGIWHTNIFGKSIEQLVEDGIRSKIAMMNDESQIKLQETMQKIVNDSNGGLICIII